MKFSTALLALLPSLVKGLKFYEDEFHMHSWCCTDARCQPSCIEAKATGPDDPILDILPFDFDFFASMGYPEPAVRDQKDFWKDSKGVGWSPWDVFTIPAVAEEYCNYYFAYIPGYICIPDGTGKQDPHFQTWNNKWYDFHGECDLDFLNAPNFGHGQGLQVQLRTKIRDGFSFIETAAMMIGGDVLEVSSWGDYALNGVASADLTDASLGSYDIEYTYESEKKQSFRIVTDDNQDIHIKTFKDFVDVEMKHADGAHFKGAVGMLGAYPSGKWIAQDGSLMNTNDPNEFAMEWQVRGKSLFTMAREPQYPNQCILPDTQAASTQRRLGERGVTEEQAAVACANSNQKELCMYDVMATGDLEYATSGAY